MIAVIVNSEYVCMWILNNMYRNTMPLQCCFGPFTLAFGKLNLIHIQLHGDGSLCVLRSIPSFNGSFWNWLLIDLPEVNEKEFVSKKNNHRSCAIHSLIPMVADTVRIFFVGSTYNVWWQCKKYYNNKNPTQRLFGFSIFSIFFFIWFLWRAGLPNNHRSLIHQRK